MFKRYAILLTISLAIFMLMAPSASAQNEAWSIGGGYFTLPNVSVEGVDDAGFFASIAMRSQSYYMEFDYGLGDSGFIALAADYLYPLTEAETGTNMFSGTAYIGAGYTYFSCDDLDNTSGFNVMLAADLGDMLFGTIRYDFLGKDQELITIGVTYSFK